MATQIPNPVGTRNYLKTLEARVTAIETAYVTLTGIQTLTNKTLTAPTINSPVVTRSVTAHTADFALTADQSGSVHTSVGASGTITCSLPAATVGTEFFFKVGAAQQLRLDPNGTETIALPSTGVQSSAGAYIVADAAGETVHIMCDVAGTWSVYGYTGTWTAV